MPQSNTERNSLNPNQAHLLNDVSGNNSDLHSIPLGKAF